MSARDGSELLCLQNHVCDSLGAGGKQRKKTKIKKGSLSVISKRTIIFKLLLLSLRFRDSALE